MNYLFFLFIAALGVFYYNTLVWMIESWINNQYYSHGFLVPVISGYFLFSMRKELNGLEKKSSPWGLALIVTGILLQAIGILWTVRFISGISFIIMISGTILFLYGKEVFKKTMFPVLFLFFMIPLPFVNAVAPQAQMISAIVSSNTANFFGLPVEREGLILYLPTVSFEIGLLCSGLSSIISLMMIAAIYAFIVEGGMFMKVSILLSSVPLALTGNIMRITSVLVVAEVFGAEAAVKYFHDLSSLLLFSVVLACLFLVGRCFGRLRLKKIY